LDLYIEGRDIVFNDYYEMNIKDMLSSIHRYGEQMFNLKENASAVDTACLLKTQEEISDS
jgi:hypothetical protein